MIELMVSITCYVIFLENSVGLELTVDTSVLDLHLAQSASPMQEKIAHKLKIQLDKK